MGASYTPHSMNLAKAVASSRLRSRVLSWAGCPGEGHLHQPQTLVKRRAWWVGWGEGWDGKMLGSSRKLTCAGVMKSSGRTQRCSLKKISVVAFPFGLEKKTLPVISRWNEKLLSQRRTKVIIGASQLALATTNQKQYKVYRLASLPTETIFSIHLVESTKHHVFEVYQTFSHPCRFEGGLNPLIYGVLHRHRHSKPVHYAYSENETTHFFCAFNIRNAAECGFWIKFHL